MTQQAKNIAIIGGTGSLGRGLAIRWAKAGHEVTIGSRDAARAASTAAEVSKALSASVKGTDNAAAAQAGDIVVMTVPFANHEDTLNAIAAHLDGKILVDVTVPLRPPKVRTVQLPEEGSVGKRTQQRLGENVRVVSAFQNVAAAHLADPDHEIDCDVLVCGNDKDARAEIIELAKDGGMRAWHAGRIDNSAVSEALTSALIFINSNYKIAGAGIRITGSPGSAEAATGNDG